MRKNSLKASVARIIDANLNRVKEGLRVCEEITRFLANNRRLTSSFKDLRHRLDSALKHLPASRELLIERDVSSDVGRRILGRELKRAGVSGIFFANIQRVKESARVLEEFSKLYSEKAALIFKDIRYRIYELEKRFLRYDPIRIRKK